MLLPVCLNIHLCLYRSRREKCALAESEPSWGAGLWAQAVVNTQHSGQHLYSWSTRLALVNTASIRQLQVDTSEGQFAAMNHPKTYLPLYNQESYSTLSETPWLRRGWGGCWCAYTTTVAMSRPYSKWKPPEHIICYDWITPKPTSPVHVWSRPHKCGRLDDLEAVVKLVLVCFHCRHVTTMSSEEEESKQRRGQLVWTRCQALQDSYQWSSMAKWHVSVDMWCVFGFLVAIIIGAHLHVNCSHLTHSTVSKMYHLSVMAFICGGNSIGKLPPYLKALSSFGLTIISKL